MTFPVYTIPNGVSHHMASYLSRKDHLELCLVSHATKDRFYPIFQERVGHTEASIDHLQELMVRCSLLDLNPAPVLHCQRNEGDPILMEYRPRWTTPAERVCYVVWSVADRWYAPKMCQVMVDLQRGDTCRLVCTIAELRNKVISISSIGPPDVNDVFFFLRAFEVADPETVKQAYEAISRRLSSYDFTFTKQPKALTPPFLLRLVQKASQDLIMLQPVHASHEAEGVQNRKTLLRRSQVLWECILRDYREINSLPSATQDRVKYWPVVLEEYYRYLQQLHCPGETRKAYSCMYQKVIDAPLELYSCLEKLEQPENSLDLPTFKSLWAKLLTYAPAYSASILCLINRLEYNGAVAEPARELLKGYVQTLEVRGAHGDFVSFYNSMRILSQRCLEGLNQLHMKWEDSWGN